MMWLKLPLNGLTLEWNYVPPSALNSRGSLSAQNRLSLSSTMPSFTILQLAHATVKADVIRRIHPLGAIRRMIGFLWEWGSTLTSLASNLRLDTSFYADFVVTSLIGRVGQGLALLYCQSQGYQYLGHYKLFVKKTREGPDFVLEKQSGDRALLEAKASAEPSADVKRILKKALKQLQVGFQHSNAIGSVKEGYATAALLRSPDDQKDSEVFVTSLANPTPQAQPSDDRVIRSNYGSWLMLMGYTDLATALFSPERTYEGPTMPFFPLEVRGRTTALVPIGILWMEPLVWPWLLPHREWGYYYLQGWLIIADYLRDWPILAVGLDLENLRYLTQTARQREQRLAAERLYTTKAETYEIEGGVVSIFADTTVLGIFPLKILRKFLLYLEAYSI